VKPAVASCRFPTGPNSLVLGREPYNIVAAMSQNADSRSLRVQTQNRFLDDLAKVAASALGGMSSMRQEIEGRIREQFARLLSGMELVSREEFDAVKAMAAEARMDQERLRSRLAQLEAELAKAREAAKAGSSSAPTIPPPPSSSQV
jgi:BMFP domain-containing protein YqiC